MKSVEQMYPDKRARNIADAVVDAMSNDRPMLEFILAWEEAYLAAGGRVCL